MTEQQGQRVIKTTAQHEGMKQLGGGSYFSLEGFSLLPLLVSWRRMSFVNGNLLCRVEGS